MTGAGHATRIRVPATTANLGVGFDVLGLALDLYADFGFSVSESLVIEGCDREYGGEGNLVWTSYLTACERLGVEARPLRIVEDCPIPSAGGLGSSSACVVAGVCAAQALSGSDLDPTTTLGIAAEIEGHPDNVAPAVLGGLVSSYIDGDGRVRSRGWEVAEGLRFVCMAPSYRVLTEDARRALPQEVPLSTVSWQVGRCLALVSALGSGDGEEIRACSEDRVHEPFRAALIPDYGRLRERALDAGASAFLISGSGATMVAVTDGDEIAAEVASAAADEVADLWVRTLHASPHGARVV